MADSIDRQALAQAQQRTWSEGDFARVAGLITMAAEELVEALEILPDERILDVACGSGNGAIAAARRSWGTVVGVDFVPAMLARARERAALERLPIDFVEGEATALPFDQGEFDVVMSIFGAIFAPDQEKAAAELLRVCKPGGRIGMTNWAPDGAAGDIFMTVARHLPPPPGFKPPTLWGSVERIRELFGDGISELRVERRASRQTFRSADHWIDFFRANFGPTKVAFDQVGPDGEEALAADLRRNLEAGNTDGDRALVLEPEYLQVVAIRT